jgi:peptide deformylase
MAARIIHHEYDHIDGILFNDHLKPPNVNTEKEVGPDISKEK